MNTVDTLSQDCVEYIPIPAEFETLAKRAHELIRQIAGDDAGDEWKQVLVFQTEDDQIHEAIILVDKSGLHADERLLQTIGAESAVIRLVCCWSSGELDMPMYDFRQKLCHLNSRNRDAEMLLIGDRRFLVKPIKATMPKE